MPIYIYIYVPKPVYQALALVMMAPIVAQMRTMGKLVEASEIESGHSPGEDVVEMALSHYNIKLCVYHEEDTLPGQFENRSKTEILNKDGEQTCYAVMTHIVVPDGNGGTKKVGHWDVLQAGCSLFTQALM